MLDSLMVISTFAIAIFAGMTWSISKKIHESTEKRDKEINDILLKVIASNLILVPGTFEPTVLKEAFDKIYNELKNMS